MRNVHTNHHYICTCLYECRIYYTRQKLARNKQTGLLPVIWLELGMTVQCSRPGCRTVWACHPSKRCCDSRSRLWRLTAPSLPGGKYRTFNAPGSFNYRSPEHTHSLNNTQNLNFMNINRYVLAQVLKSFWLKFHCNNLVWKADQHNARCDTH